RQPAAIVELGASRLCRHDLERVALDRVGNRNDVASRRLDKRESLGPHLVGFGERVAERELLSPTPVMLLPRWDEITVRPVVEAPAGRKTVILFATLA